MINAAKKIEKRKENKLPNLKFLFLFMNIDALGSGDIAGVFGRSL